MTVSASPIGVHLPFFTSCSLSPSYHKAFFLSSFVSLQILNFLRTVVRNVFPSRFLILAALLSHIHQ